jgi:anti-anti-sigma factor
VSREPRFSFVIGRAMGTVVVTARGELDAPACNQLGRVLRDLIEGQGNLTVVVDLNEVASIHSSGVRVLVEAVSLAEERGGLLMVSDPPHATRDKLEACGMACVILTHRSRQDQEGRQRGAARRDPRSDHPSGQDQPQPSDQRDDSPWSAPCSLNAFGRRALPVRTSSAAPERRRRWALLRGGRSGKRRGRDRPRRLASGR